MWTLRKLIRVGNLPDERIVILFRFRRYDDRSYWLVLTRPEVDLGMEDPGYEVNLEIEGMVAALARVCLGRVDLPRAVKCGDVELRGAISDGLVELARRDALRRRGACPDPCVTVHFLGCPDISLFPILAVNQDTVIIGRQV